MEDNSEQKRTKTMHELLGIEPEVSFILPTGEALPVPQTIPDAASEPPQPEAAAEVDLSEFEKKGIFQRDAIRYPLIFIMASVFFFVVLNFQAILSFVGGKIPIANNASSTEESAGSAEYQTWMRSHYAYISDQNILRPGHDADQDGLTNLDEFYLKTDPFVADTDKDGFDDGREVLNAYNPLYEGRFTVVQQNIVASNIDLEAVDSRKNFTAVAGAVSGDFAVDIEKPGIVSVPKLGISAPVIWSKSLDIMEEDLKRGIAHHPGTPLPGSRGTASIHGHSSGNFTDGDYKTVFTRISELEFGDEVLVTIYGPAGTSRTYRFTVREAKVYSKDDQKQFADLGGYNLNLSTSWPIGTALERYVVTTELVGVSE